MKIHQALLMVIIAIGLMGCGGNLSYKDAAIQIKKAYEATLNAPLFATNQVSEDMLFRVDVKILGISQNGDTAVVRAALPLTTQTAKVYADLLKSGVMAEEETHIFNFRKYDSGWVIEH